MNDDIEILLFNDQLAPYFEHINGQWINAMFVLEDIDKQVLQQPQPRSPFGRQRPAEPADRAFSIPRAIGPGAVGEARGPAQTTPLPAPAGVRSGCLRRHRSGAGVGRRV